MDEVPALSWMYEAIRGATRVELEPVTDAAPDAEEKRFSHETAYGLKLAAPTDLAVKWPSMPDCDVLMVRHFYDRFVERHVWCVLSDEEGDVPRPKNRLVITGTPGIGKSAFGMYLLHRALNAGKTVVFVRNE
ncbi:MAG: hypothetical protein EOO65_00770 [Methanosarcinales archaeon]|nr:MAG: hypothetical protein EOO65_00770 [Methanosarcinales archaeon]